jgi:hypothetical protein
MQRVKRLLIGLFVVGATLPVLPTFAQLPQLTAVNVFPLGGTRFTCSSSVLISAKLGSAQPLIVSGHCVEPAALSISDTRTNITILGKGSGACGDGRNTTLTVVEQPVQPVKTIQPNSASTIVDVRGKNILITGFEIFGVSNNPNVDNRRGIRIQRGGTMQVGRNVANLFDSTFYDEQSGVCIRDLGKAGIEAAGGAFVRVTNTEITNVGGDAISIGEQAAGEVGFTSGGEFNLITDAFPSTGHAGPNWLHNNVGHGVSLTRNSSARIIGNNIAHNGTAGSHKDGINVTRNSSADAQDNLFDGNTGWAIQLSDNSNANLGASTLGGPVNPAAGFCSDFTPGQPCGSPTGTATLTSNPNVVVNNANGDGNIKCTRSTVAGKWSIGRDGLAAGSLADNNTGAPVAMSVTSCTSSVN